MSRTIRKNSGSKSYLRSYAGKVSGFCHTCGSSYNTRISYYEDKCCSYPVYCTTYEYPKTYVDGAFNPKYKQGLKKFCSRNRRAAEKRDLYNAVYDEDHEYYDTESKNKGIIFDFI